MRTVAAGLLLALYDSGHVTNSTLEISHSSGRYGNGGSEKHIGQYIAKHGKANVCETAS